MKKQKQYLSMLITLYLVASLMGIPTNAVNITFSDISSSAWYAQDVTDVQGYGIIQGRNNGAFDPDGTLTLAEAITMAARTYAYETGDPIPDMNCSPWYSDYIQYATNQNICGLGEFGTAYNNFCNRLTMAKIFSRVLPKDSEYPLNSVTQIPDVQDNEENAPVFYLYNQGVLTGSDQYGTFHPYQPIKRSETAAILNRVLDANHRKTFQLQEKPSSPYTVKDYRQISDIGSYSNATVREYADENEWWDFFNGGGLLADENALSDYSYLSYQEILLRIASTFNIDVQYHPDYKNKNILRVVIAGELNTNRININYGGSSFQIVMTLNATNHEYDTVDSITIFGETYQEQEGEKVLVDLYFNVINELDKSPSDEESATILTAKNTYRGQYSYEDVVDSFAANVTWDTCPWSSDGMGGDLVHAYGTDQNGEFIQFLFEREEEEKFQLINLSTNGTGYNFSQEERSQAMDKLIEQISSHKISSSSFMATLK